jgi:membrane protein
LSYEIGSEVAPTVRFNIIMLALVEIPRLLLARRVPWRLLVPQAALTAVGMTVLGVAFTLLSPLWGAGLVLAITTGIGAYLTMPTWSRASPGSVTPPSSSTSPARGS